MNKMKEVIQLAVDVELIVGELYEFFSTKFEEDFDFWYRIATEEEQHAALIKGAEELLLKEKNYFTDSLSQLHDVLKKEVKELKKFVKECKSKTLSRQDAFRIAQKLENSATELHFQKFVTKSPDTKLEQIFQQLAKEDKNHADRIKQYIKEHFDS